MKERRGIIATSALSNFEISRFSRELRQFDFCNNIEIIKGEEDEYGDSLVTLVTDEVSGSMLYSFLHGFTSKYYSFTSRWDDVFQFSTDIVLSCRAAQLLFIDAKHGLEKSLFVLRIAGVDMQVVFFPFEGNVLSIGLFLPQKDFCRKVIQINENGAIWERGNVIWRIPDSDIANKEPDFKRVSILTTIRRIYQEI